MKIYFVMIKEKSAQDTPISFWESKEKACNLANGLNRDNNTDIYYVGEGEIGQ